MFSFCLVCLTHSEYNAYFSDDGSEVLWKSNFESHYTDITELGR